MRIQKTGSSMFLPMCLAPFLARPVTAPAVPTVVFANQYVAGVRINLVTIDLNSDVVVTPAIAERGIGTSESFRSMMRRMRPAAAINGTFFDVRLSGPPGTS